MVHCSFCGRNQEQVDTLISGTDAYICNECVDVCQEMVRGERRATPTWLGDVDDAAIHNLAGDLRVLQHQLAELSQQLGRMTQLAQVDADRMEHA